MGTKKEQGEACGAKGHKMHESGGENSQSAKYDHLTTRGESVADRPHCCAKKPEMN